MNRQSGRQKLDNSPLEVFISTPPQKRLQIRHFFGGAEALHVRHPYFVPYMKGRQTTEESAFILRVRSVFEWFDFSVL